MNFVFNQALESKLLKDTENPTIWLKYAEWLKKFNDPRWEVIELEVACSQEKKKNQVAYWKKIHSFYDLLSVSYLPLEVQEAIANGNITIHWRFGFIRRLYFEAIDDRSLIDLVIGLDLARLVSEIEIFMVSSDNINYILKTVSKSNITLMSLHDNKITHLPEIIRAYVALKKLLLANNRLQEIPDWIGGLDELTNLNLYSNNISTLPISLKKLSKLETLNITNNSFYDLPACIPELLNLQVLDFGQNQINNLPNNMKNLTKLIELVFYDNQITIFPDWICDFIDLKMLIMSGNKIEVLHQGIGSLVELTYLEIGRNKIKEVPDSFYKLQNLRKLGLKSLPFGADKLSEIKKRLPKVKIHGKNS